jgi:hypothetical protein
MAAMTDEERRVRSYLTAQAAKLTPAEIIGKVRVAMVDLRAAALAVPAARFADRPAADEWSGREVMAHVVDSGRRVAAGITGILDGGPGGALPAADPPDVAPDVPADVPKEASATEWCDRLAADRDALFARVLAADPAARLDRGIEVSAFGALTWREMLLFLRLHDLDHAGQLRKIATALG